MPESIPTEFTPCLAPLLQEYGPVGACVYGRVWRYAQMKDGVCNASHETIAGELNLTRRTVWRWIKILCDDGYLVDLTPDVTNHTHKYRATDKISTVIEIHTTEEAQPEQCASSTQPGVNEMHSQCVNGSLEERERSIKKEDQESADADGSAYLRFTTFQEWHSYVREAENKSQRIHRLWLMCERLYPGLDPPAHGYVGRVAKRLHAGRMADLLWTHAPHPPTGNLLDYIQGVAKNGTNRGNHRPTGTATGEGTLTPESQAIADALRTGYTEHSGDP